MTDPRLQYVAQRLEVALDGSAAPPTLNPKPEPQNSELRS